jgi:hypothetical protein
MHERLQTGGTIFASIRGFGAQELQRQDFWLRRAVAYRVADLPRRRENRLRRKQ